MLRRVLASALYYSGLLWILAGFRLRGRAAVLMYHRVLPAGADSFSHRAIVISPETFAAHMQFLKRHFRLLTPRQFADELCGPGFGRRACLVTFDDGWQDNLLHALPILEQHRVPVTVFVATAFVGSGHAFWQERLTRLLYRASRSPAIGGEALRSLEGRRAMSMGDEAARKYVRDLVTTLKRHDPDKAQRLLRQLEAEAAAAAPDALAPGDDRFMSWAELQRLRQSGLVSIGSHAHTHSPLPSLGYAGARTEFTRSLEELQSHGFPAPVACAYPNGNVDDAVEAAARDAGFRLGFATGHGHVRDGDNALRLRRINMHEQSSATRAEFLCLLLGVL